MDGVAAVHDVSGGAGFALDGFHEQVYCRAGGAVEEVYFLCFNMNTDVEVFRQVAEGDFIADGLFWLG